VSIALRGSNTPRTSPRRGRQPAFGADAGLLAVDEGPQFGGSRRPLHPDQDRAVIGTARGRRTLDATAFLSCGGAWFMNLSLPPASCDPSLFARQSSVSLSPMRQPPVRALPLVPAPGGSI
jgi:hypothetical protein